VEAVEAMDDRTLAVAREFLPLLQHEAANIRYASIAGQELAPHPDYFNVALMTNSSHAYLKTIGDRNGVTNLTQDNGFRVLLIALALNIGVLGGRNGNDLRDSTPWQFELKTCSLENKNPCFGTHHHLDRDRIEKYRDAGFIFAVFSKGKPVCAWVVHPDALAFYFDKWEKSLFEGEKDHHNNRFISINYVREVGTVIYGDPLPDDWQKIYGTTEESQNGGERDPETMNTLEQALAISRERWTIRLAKDHLRKMWKTIENHAKAARKAARMARKAIPSSAGGAAEQE
jgi:hypothetical protein